MCSVPQCKDTGSAFPALVCTSRAAGQTGKCTAPAESAVRWITRPTARPGPLCRGRSPPSWVQAERELHPSQLQLPLQAPALLPQQDLGPPLEMSLLRRSERREAEEERWSEHTSALNQHRTKPLSEPPPTPPPIWTTTPYKRSLSNLLTPSPRGCARRPLDPVDGSTEGFAPETGRTQLRLKTQPQAHVTRWRRSAY